MPKTNTHTNKIYIKQDDLVEVIAGRDKGKQGKVLEVVRDRNRVIVEGINQVKKHMKPTQKSPQGGIVNQPTSMHISNVMLVDPESKKPTRIGKKLVGVSGSDKKQWVRVSKKSGKQFDQGK